MKILVLLPDSPGPWSNTAARYYAPLLKTLGELGHDVTALALDRPGGDGTGYLHGSPVHVRLFPWPAPRPLFERKLRSGWRGGWELEVSEFGRAARAEAEKNYDCILAEMPETARVLEDDPRTLLSVHHFRFEDLGSLGPRDPLRVRVERWQARRAELSTCRRVAAIRTTSRRLARLCARHGVRARPEVVPICIDPALYRPLPAPPVPTVGVLGSMFWPPSRRAAEYFLEHIVPRIRALRSGTRFLVGGWQAKRFLSAAVRADDIELIEDFPSPADAFARLSVLVATPPVGTGMKVKVLEAMAYGVPVVVNHLGFEGLDADGAPPVRLADSPDAVAAEVADLLVDPNARAWVVEEGRRCIERTFSPFAVTTAMLRLARDRQSVVRVCGRPAKQRDRLAPPETPVVRAAGGGWR